MPKGVFSALFHFLKRDKSKVGESSSEERAIEAADLTTRPLSNSPAQQGVDLYSTEGDIGIKVIVDPTEATIDIVFVHGLTGNRVKTWTHSSGLFLPEELTNDLPTARIMTFGYEADVVKLWGMPGSNTLRDHGKNLASDVSDQRRSCRERPIIFIAHSIGGLVCEQALLICREGEADLEKVFHSTRGIIFLGTPHGGAALAKWGHMFAKYLKVIRYTNPAVLGVLERSSEVLTAVQQQFQQILLKPNVSIKIYCFFEEKPVVGIGTIVPQESAVLNQYPNQSIGANHMDMTRFSGRNDAGYQRILNRVRDIVELGIFPAAIDISQSEPLGISGQSPLLLGNHEPFNDALEQRVPPNHTVNTTSSGPASAIGSQSMQGGFNIHYTSHLDHEKTNICLQLLRTSEYERHKDRNPHPVKGTCQWFFTHPNYENWRNTMTSNLLWVSADPGCGKSVLSKFLVENEKLATGNRSVCYFFFKDDNEEQKTATNALCALLHQLFTQRPELLRYAIKVYDQNGDSFITNVDLLWNLLTTASTDPKAGETICILDALDECRGSELKYLLSKVFTFYKGYLRSSCKTVLKLLVTSRPLQPIVDEFNTMSKDLSTIHLAGEEDTDQIKHEIDLVIQDELEKIQQKWRLDDKALSPLRKELCKAEHRTYLWLKLIFDLIRKDVESITKRGRQKIFGTIPSSVDAAYTRILNQSTDKKQAKKLLQIVCTAARPLYIKEMSIAISIQPDDETLEDLEIGGFSEEYSKMLIRNLCGLFVSVIDGRVYLLHQTAKEFLLGEYELSQQADAGDWIWKHSLTMKDSHFVLAHICMWYLRLKGFLQEDNNLSMGKIAAKLVSKYDFLDYAAINWPTHFREATIPMGHTSIILALDICNPQEYLYTIWHPVYECPSLGVVLDTKTSTLYLASLFGHQGVVATLLTVPGIEVNIKDNHGQTPLYCAALCGHAAIVAQLLAAPEIDVNIKDNNGRTPLYSAVFYEHAAIVAQLLAAPEIDVNIKDNNGRTPLYYVAFYGHAAIVAQLLAAPEIDVNIKDNDGRTPLYYAAFCEHAAIVTQLLAAPGIDVNITDNNGWTPLYYAAFYGHAAIVTQLLAAPGIDVNITDNDGWTPLYCAAKYGHAAIVTQLLAAPGIDVNRKDNDGQTPLYSAANNIHAAIMALLLAAPEIDVNIIDNYGRTPLYSAALYGYADIVAQLLAAPGIDVNITDNDGWTPLHRAAKSGHAAIVTQLLAAPGIDLRAITKASDTALDIAVRRGHNEVIKQLRAAFENIGFDNQDGV